MQYGIIAMGEAKLRKAQHAGVPARAASEPAGDDAAASGPSAVLQKSCGSCTKCCTVMGVPELKKPPWQECQHVTAGLGCKIYLERPSGCRTFICGWLLDPHMGMDLKPENCHVIFYQKNEQNIVATCDANYPDAWRAPNVIEFLHRLATSVGPHRRVILLERGRSWFVTENAIVPTDTG
jgi:hypothetical protein